MKGFRLFRLCLLCSFLGIACTSGAQDFKLYFANNISDLPTLDDFSFDMPELDWREVKGGMTHDIAGNQVEVEEVMRMFGDSRMKGVADQQLFWRMRDHCMLCFRIDNCGQPGTFSVEVNDGDGEHGTLTVSRSFFVNVCRRDKPVEIKVSRTDNPSSFILFKYFVYDWDDENLYLFQLDSKRQVTGETYTLEYMLGYTDEEGDYHADTHSLDLCGSAFQSFYVPKDKDLVDMMLKTGETGGDHKLRLNMRAMHTGVNPDPDFEAIKLRTDFKLDKHEGRELVNFNWIGTGLYERYDTLFLTVLTDKSEVVKKAEINVCSVDTNGVAVPAINARDLGYDAKRKAFKILTYGNPAYVEIIANGMCPTVYKYPGAADPRTHIVDEALCKDVVKLFALPKQSDGGITVSGAHLLTLNDTKRVTVMQSMDHMVCDLLDDDISIRPKADTLVFVDDAGNSWPKVLNYVPVSHYAKLELTFSSPRAQSVGNPSLKAVVAEDNMTYTGRWPDVTVLHASDYPGFERDYYYMRYDMVEMVPVNKYFRLTLETPGYTYDRFPCMMNIRVDRDKLKDGVEKQVNEEIAADRTNDGTKALADADYNLQLPMSFQLSVKPLSISQSLVFDIKKQIVTSTTSLTYKRGGMLEPGESRPGESKEMSDMRKEACEYASGTKIDGYDKDKYSVIGKDVVLDDWVMKEMDDIFSFDGNRLGQGWFGGGKMVMTCGLGPKLFTHGLQMQQASGTIGYGIGVMVPDIFDWYLGTSTFAQITRMIPTFKIGANFELSAQLDFGVKTLNSKYPMSVYELCDNFGYFAFLSGKFKVGAWMEVGTPPNPLLNINAGLRAGCKAGLSIGIANRFEASLPDFGISLMGLLGVEAYAKINTFGFQWAGRATATFGARGFYPRNDGHNPFHPMYPYWITDRDKDKKNLPLLQPRRLPDMTFGEALVENVGSNANPHFLSDSLVVYNDLVDPVDDNDDRVALLNTNSNTTTTLSTEGTGATNHMRSKRGEYEVVVYEQQGRVEEPIMLGGPHAVRRMNEMGQQTQIVAKMRNGNSPWRQTIVIDEDGQVNCKPVVTIQDNGHAACIWQRGLIKELVPRDETDTLYNSSLDGYLVVSCFDGDKWSEPVNLFRLNEKRSVAAYDLMMRNDSVLVGASLANNPLDSANYYREFKFASVEMGSSKVSIVDESVNPQHFFMNRVGQHAVVAMLYEKNDSTRDIFVKTMRMDGHGDGLAGSDIGANFCSPHRVKIICDRAASQLDHFAVLWTEMNNAMRGEDADNYGDEVCTMLNASRIILMPSPHVTAPLTLGAERDSLLMLDFDGFLDDSRIKVVYSLADIDTGEAVIMSNERYFTNSFEYDVEYTRQALLGGSQLPVSFNVRNTGTSPIRRTQFIINGKEFELDDTYVAPSHNRKFVVQYPIDENFDGYLSTQVIVDYENVFRAQNHPTSRNISFRHQLQSMPANYVGVENVECELVGHSVENGTNYFVVELTDHSPRGLNCDVAVRVGIYPHVMIDEPINDESEVIVTADDFSEYAGQRKAIVTVKVPGIVESAKAYLNVHVFNLELNSISRERAAVPNVPLVENAHYVTLLPDEDPTVIEQIKRDIAANGSLINVVKEDNGLRVSGLTPGDRLRVFASNGIMVYSCSPEGGEVFVPIKRHDVYLLSTAKESRKFSF